MALVNKLSDVDLRNELINLGFNAGPVTGTTRKLYEKKLETLRKNSFLSNSKSSKNISTNFTKQTPTKDINNQAILMTTPLSAKRKGKKLQNADTESSDNELDLTLPINGSPIEKTSKNLNPNKKTYFEKNSINLSTDQEQSSLKNAIKRTPTPPRSSPAVNKRLPLRLSEVNDNKKTRNHLYLSQGYNSAQSSYVSHSNFEDEDDHTETSRTLSPNNRFDLFRSSFGNEYKPHLSCTFNNKESPIDKLRRFSRDAWGFFSRPINSTTPCANNTSSKVSRYYRCSESCDVSGLLLKTVVFVFFSLAAAYLLMANLKTVENGKTIIHSAVHETLKIFYTYAILPLVFVSLVIALSFSGYRIHKYWTKKKIEQKNRLMSLVDRITDVIQDTGGEGIPEHHVRDMIMPPTKRTQDDWSLWKKAADFINLEDSRVRTEVRLIDGDECNVWVWVPVAKQKWQGTAIAENSLTSCLPTKALTRCIKLRGMSFSNRQSEKDELRIELLRKLSPIVPVHMEFCAGAENIVYMMLKDLDDAKNAFSTFHSHWFNGGLISAKYIRDERYAERFPEFNH